MKNILYIGQMFYTEDGTEFTEIHNDKKIGITKNLDNRSEGLSGTNSPFVWVPLKAWKKLDGAAGDMETILHNLKREERVTGRTRGKKSEWFSDEDEMLVSDIAALMDNHPEWEIYKELENTKDEIVKKVGTRTRNAISDSDYVSLLEGRSLKGVSSGHAYTITITEGVCHAVADKDPEVSFSSEKLGKTNGDMFSHYYRLSGKAKTPAPNKKYLLEANTNLTAEDLVRNLKDELNKEI